jgi:type II secretory pathway pseudopilin PulG
MKKRVMILNNRWGRDGFTVVELVISIGLFTILASMAITGFVHVLRVQRQVSSVVASNNNMILAFEQMVREMRTGSSFCAQENFPFCVFVGDETDSICFLNGLLETVVYQWDSAEGKMLRGVAEDAFGSVLPGELCDRAADPTRAKPITGDNVNIRHLSFRLFGHLYSGSHPSMPAGDPTEGKYHPPRITVTMGVAPRTGDAQIGQSVRYFQTTVSARITE